MTRRNFLKIAGCLLIVPQAIQAKFTLREIKNNNEPKSLNIIYESEPYILEPKEIKKISKPKYKGYHQKKLGKPKRRMLNLYNPHTREKLKTVYFKDGEYQEDSLKRVNHFFRDFRENKSIEIDLELIDLLYTLQKKQSKTQPLYLLSGYRTNKTNRKVGGAKRSEHKTGRAADIRPKYTSKTKIKKLKKDAKKIRIGGVGLYARSGFVHVDSGRVRSWNG